MKEFLRDERGQDLVEYALILAAVGLAMISTVTQIVERRRKPVRLDHRAADRRRLVRGRAMKTFAQYAGLAFLLGAIIVGVYGAWRGWSPDFAR